MAVETKHPTLTAQRESDWDLCRDSYEGEGLIKAAGPKYLPRPSGYADNQAGNSLYAAYKERAQFPEIMASSVGAMLGIIHDKEIVIEMPDSLGFLLEDADGEGMTLTDFHKEITRQLLVMGRYGVLADAPMGGGNPYLSGYTARNIINWDIDFFVLDETEMVRDGFNWNLVRSYRVLGLDNGVHNATIMGDDGDTDITPTRQGGGALNIIPFAVASAKCMGPDIETPPLIGIARSAKAIYQLSADRRLQLFMSGQETWVTINADAPDQVGAGIAISLHGEEGMPVDAKYVTPACTGITAHKEAIDDEKDAAVQYGARLFEQSQQANESGSARKMRFRSESANLRTVAQASCSLLEKSLRNVAMILGQGDSVINGITVTPPKDLLDATMTPQDAQALWQLVLEGGLSSKTYYERAQAGGIANEDRDYDEEFADIENDIDRADGLTPERDAPLTT